MKIVPHCPSKPRSRRASCNLWWAVWWHIKKWWPSVLSLSWVLSKWVTLGLPVAFSWGDFGPRLNQLIPNLGRVTPSRLMPSQCRSDNFPAPGETAALIGSPADFISTDNPWCPMKPYHRTPQGFWAPTQWPHMRAVLAWGPFHMHYSTQTARWS